MRRASVQGRVRLAPKERVVTRWPKLFTKKRKFADLKFIQTRDDLVEVAKEAVDTSFQDFESTIPSWDIAVVRRFFHAEQQNPSTQLNTARARLDDRDCETHRVRSYPDWIDATELHRLLAARRFDSVDHPGSNADRRLVYIYGLSSDYIMSLIKTASHHQMPALRDTICKHVEGETSIRIHIPVDGFKTFQLEFHVPFPTLRYSHTADSGNSGTADGKIWLDVDFLDIECDRDDGPCSWILKEANVSVVVCGWDHCRWVGWAFSNTLSDPTSRDEEEPEVPEDHFAADRDSPGDVRIVDANDPIWEPREYWLRIVNIRMIMIHEEWKWLVRNVERRIEAWVHNHDIKLASGFKDRKTQEEVFDWLIKTMHLLSRLNERFSTMMQIWTRFSATGGHIEYLSEMRRPKITAMINNLKEIFERLADLQGKLMSLQKTVGVTKTTLMLYMEHENNRMNAESQRFNYDTNKRSHEMAEINREIHELNRTSTRAAVETGRTTHTNVQLFVITTPFILALQYFGAEKDIFSFERNPKTFSIAVCILFCIFPILTYILNTVNHRRHALFWGLWRKAGKESLNGATSEPAIA